MSQRMLLSRSSLPNLHPRRQDPDSSSDEGEEEQPEDEVQGGRRRRGQAADELGPDQRVKELGTKLLQAVLDVKTDWGYQLATPFLELPDREAYPGYYALSKNPTCISILQRKVESGHYRRLRGLRDQLVNCFGDCKRFNRPDSSIWAAAQQLEEVTLTTARALDPSHAPGYRWATSEELSNLVEHVASQLHAKGRSSYTSQDISVLAEVGGKSSMYAWSRQRSYQGWRNLFDQRMKEGPMQIAVQAALDRLRGDDVGTSPSGARLSCARSSSNISSPFSDVVLVTQSANRQSSATLDMDSSNNRGPYTNSLPSPSASRSPPHTSHPTPSTRRANPFARDVLGLSEAGPSNYASRARSASEADMDIDDPGENSPPPRLPHSSRKRRRVPSDPSAFPEPESIDDLERLEADNYKLEAVKSGLHSLQEARKTMEATFVEHRTELERIEDDRARTTARWDKEKRSLVSTISKLEEQVQELKGSEVESTEASRDLESSLREEITSLKTALAAKKTRRIREMSPTLGTPSSSDSNQNQEIARLKAELAKARDYASSLRDENEQLLSRRDALREGLAQLDARR